MSIHARVIGSGPHRVLVTHDWFVPTGAWGCFLDYLDTAQFSYALLDARGYGDRRDVPGQYSIRALAGDLIALADQLGWDEFSLVGHSMGAKAAQRAMADTPGRVRKLVGITPTPAGSVPLSEQQEAAFTAAASSPTIRRELLDFATGNRLGTPWLDHMVHASLQGSAPAAFAAYAQSFARTDFATDIAGNPTPIKVIAGQHDQAISTDAIRDAWLPYYPNIQLEVLANAGHYPMHETPVTLATSIESFLAA